VTAGGNVHGSEGYVGSKNGDRAAVEGGLPPRIVSIDRHQIAGGRQLRLDPNPVGDELENAARPLEVEGRKVDRRGREHHFPPGVEGGIEKQPERRGPVRESGASHDIASGKRVGDGEPPNGLGKKARHGLFEIEVFEPAGMKGNDPAYGTDLQESPVQRRALHGSQKVDHRGHVPGIEPARVDVEAPLEPPPPGHRRKWVETLREDLELRRQDLAWARGDDVGVVTAQVLLARAGGEEVLVDVQSPVVRNRDAVEDRGTKGNERSVRREIEGSVRQD